MNAVRNAQAERELHEVIAQLADSRWGVTPSLVIQVSAKVKGVIDGLWVAIKRMERRIGNLEEQLRRCTFDNEKLRAIICKLKKKKKKDDGSTSPRKIRIDSNGNSNMLKLSDMTNRIPALEALRTGGNLPRKTVGRNSHGQVAHPVRKDGQMPIEKVNLLSPDASPGMKRPTKEFANSYERKKEELFDRLEREWLPETTESVAERRKYNTQDLLEKEGISESAAARREKLVNTGIIESEDIAYWSNANADSNSNGNSKLTEDDDNDDNEDADAESGVPSNSDNADNADDADNNNFEPWLWKPPPPSEEPPVPVPPPALPTFGDVQRTNKRRRSQSQAEEDDSPPVPCERCRRTKRQRMEEVADRKGKAVNEKVWQRWISGPGNCLEYVHADEPVVKRHTEFDLDFSDDATQSPPQLQT